MLNSCVTVLTGVRSTDLFSWPKNTVPGQSRLARLLLCWVYLVAREGGRCSGPFLRHIHILRLVPSPAHSSAYAGHTSALSSRTPVLGHMARSGPRLETLREWHPLNTVHSCPGFLWEDGMWPDHQVLRRV